MRLNDVFRVEPGDALERVDVLREPGQAEGRKGGGVSPVVSNVARDACTHTALRRPLSARSLNQ